MPGGTMTSSQDPERRRNALEKALEGRRLARSGDYQGAIAACTEAIELAPDFLGPYGTRAEAYKRLGMDEEAASDLGHLHEVNNQRIPTTHIGGAGLVWKGVGAVFLIGFGVLLAIAPGVSDTPRWISVLGVLTLILGLAALVAIIASPEEWNPLESAELAGTVTRKRDNSRSGNEDGSLHSWITVSTTEFEVTKGLYDSVSLGDDVVLTVRGPKWFDSFLDHPQTGNQVVIAITHGTSPTAQRVTSRQVV